MLNKTVNAFTGWFTHFASRRLEWCLAFYTTYFGLILTLPPKSMSSQSFSVALYQMTETQWGAVYLIVGIAHIMSLHINGRAAWTPFVRVGALFINCQVFLALSVSLGKVNSWGTGTHNYGFIALVFCGVALYAAAHDCGREIKIWRGRHGELLRR